MGQTLEFILTPEALAEGGSMENVIYTLDQ